MTASLEQVKWIELPSVHDERGVLTAVESGMDIPIKIERVFYMHHIIQDRGGHAHLETDQVVVAMSGEYKIKLSNGVDEIEFKMNDPVKGLYIPRMIFIELFDFSPGSVCMVLANSHYDIKQSLRSKADYLDYLKNANGQG